MRQRSKQSGFERVMPWMAGAGFAFGHIAMTSSCTLTTQGRCISCGGCVVALVSIVAWAKTKKQGGDFFAVDKNSCK